MKKAPRRRSCCNGPDVTRLLSAQAAEMSGDRAKASSYYKEMLADDRTRFVGVQGLMQHKLDDGDTDTALALAQEGHRAAARQRARAADGVRPAVEEGRLGRRADHAQRRGARPAAAARRRHPPRRGAVAGRRPRGAGRRRQRRGSEAALQANRLAPTLVPAAALAARVQADKGAKRKATKLLINAWAANPHPDLAAAFAALEPDETPGTPGGSASAP